MAQVAQRLGRIVTFRRLLPSLALPRILRRRAVGNTYMARLRGDARQPVHDRGVRLELEPGLTGHMRIGIERDVGNAVVVADEEAVSAQMALHDREGIAA